MRLSILQIQAMMAFIACIPGMSAFADAPYCRLVTAPTAGSLPSRTYLIESHLFEGGGIMQMASLGATGMIDVGISYSGTPIIGSTKVTWQPHVGFHVRIRIVEETLRAPAVLVGFDSQGTGPYLKGGGLNRFRVKSRGGYAVVSRNYSLLGNLGVHGGANYSLEGGDGDRDLSFWLGANKSVGGAVELCAEYDFATNDNESRSMNAENGYLNAAFKLRFGGAFTFEIDLANLLRNRGRDSAGHFVENPAPSREVRIYYMGKF